MNDEIGQEEVEGKSDQQMPGKQEPADVSNQDDDLALPDGVSERTRQQFEKLKARNLEMKEKLDQAQKLMQKEQQDLEQSVIEAAVSHAPQHENLTGQEVRDIAQGIVDEQGYLDEQELMRRLKQADEKVKRAEELATNANRKIAEFEMKQELREVYFKNPQLDPYSPQFDERQWRFFKNELSAQPKGKRNVAEAARSATEFFSSIAAPVATKPDQSKNRAQATADPRRSSHMQSVDLDELAERTRRGDMDAIAERLRRSEGK